MTLALRVVARYQREAARPIQVDKAQLSKLADKIVKMLPQYLKFRDTSSSLNTTRGFNPNTWGFFVDHYTTTDVRGHAVHVPIEVKAKESRDWKGPRRYVAGGAVRATYQVGPKGKAKGYGSKVGLAININTLVSADELLSNLSTVKKEVFSVLIHEVTHLRDLLKHEKSDLRPDQDPDDPKVYYNLPTEVRAFMQQIADEVIDYAEEIGKDDPFFLYLDRGFVERALESSGTWERIRKFLNRKNEQLILKGVTRALQDAWPALEKKYPKDEDE